MADRRPLHFYPVKTFVWEQDLGEAGSRVVGEYHAGQRYNCPEGKRYDPLYAKVLQWEADDAVTVIELPKGSMRVVEVG